MSSEEIEKSLRSEIDSYLNGRLSVLQAEVARLHSQVNEAFSGLLERTAQPAAVSDEAAVTVTIAEHLRAAHEQGVELAAQQSAQAQTVSDLALLNAAVADIDDQRSQSDILSTLVNRATAFAPRVVFFVVRQDHAQGWRARGLEGTVGDDAARQMSLSLTDEHAVSVAAHTQSLWSGTPGSNAQDYVIANMLGGEPPQHCAAVPLVVRNKTVAVLYADSATLDSESLKVEALEALLRVTGMAVELLTVTRGTPRPRPEAQPTAEEEGAPPAAQAATPEATPTAATAAEVPAVAETPPTPVAEAAPEPVAETEATAAVSEPTAEEPVAEVVTETYNYPAPVEMAEEQAASLTEPAPAAAPEMPSEAEPETPTAPDNLEFAPVMVAEEVPPPHDLAMADEPPSVALPPEVSSFPAYQPAMAGEAVPMDKIELTHEGEKGFAFAAPPVAEFAEVYPPAPPAVEFAAPPLEAVPSTTDWSWQAPAPTPVIAAPRAEIPAPPPPSFAPPTLENYASPAPEAFVPPPMPVAPEPYMPPPPVPEPFAVPNLADTAQIPHTGPLGSARTYGREIDLPISVSDDERRLHTDARRFARLLVSEIKLYNEPKVREGRDARDIYVRLRDAIDRSRQMYERRVAAPVASRFDYFHFELVNTLAEGDADKLGADYPGAAV